MDSFSATSLAMHWIVLPRFLPLCPDVQRAVTAGKTAAEGSLLVPKGGKTNRPIGGWRYHAYPKLLTARAFSFTPQTREAVIRAICKRSRVSGNKQSLSFTLYGKDFPFQLRVELYGEHHFSIVLTAEMEGPFTVDDVVAISTLPTARNNGIRFAVEKTIAVLTNNTSKARLTSQEAAALNLDYFPIIHIRSYSPRNSEKRITDDVPWHALTEMGTRHEDIEAGNRSLVEAYRKKNYEIRDDVRVIDPQSMLIVADKARLEDSQIRHSLGVALHVKRLIREEASEASIIDNAQLTDLLVELQRTHDNPATYSDCEGYIKTFPLILDRLRVSHHFKEYKQEVGRHVLNVAGDPDLVKPDHKTIARKLFEQDPAHWVSIKLVPNSVGRSGSFTYFAETITPLHRPGRQFVVKINADAVAEPGGPQPIRPGPLEQGRHSEVQQLTIRVPRLLQHVVCSPPDTATRLHGMLFEIGGNEPLDEIKNLTAHADSKTLRLNDILDNLFANLKVIYDPRLRDNTRANRMGLLGSDPSKHEDITRINHRFETTNPDVVLHLLGSTRQVDNPVRYMQQLNEDLRGATGIRLSVGWSRIHGDLHPNNILVTDKGATWIIDFRNYKDGHFYNDFTRLEAELRGRYMTYTMEGVQEVLTIEERALAKGDFFYEDVSPDARSEAGANRALECGTSIRRHCSAILESNGMTLHQDEYLFSLLSNLIAVASRKELTERKFEHTLAWSSYLVPHAKKYLDRNR